MKWIIVLLLPLFAFSQEEYYNNLKKLPPGKLKEEVTAKINSLEQGELCGFFNRLKDHNISLKPFEGSILSKANHVSSAHILYCITEILVELDIDTVPIEKTLYFRKDVWDKGEWSQEFWQLIRINKLVVPVGEFYTVDDIGYKHYNVDGYLSDKIKKGELGKDPALEINYEFIDYNEGELLETLAPLDIKEIEVIPKSKSTGLFGKKGVDGVLIILTRK
jgi:hypothetical protein